MKVEVELCMGSSCFARGNSRMLTFLENYISAGELESEINITGHLCMGNCSGGPVIRINGTEYLEKSETQIGEIIGECLGEQ